MLTVSGGKLTTYRAMAEEIVDAVVRELHRRPKRPLTDRQPLPGGDIPSLGHEIAQAARVIGDVEVAERLAAIVQRHPNVERILCGHVHRAAQIRFAGTVVATAPSTAATAIAPIKRLHPLIFQSPPLLTKIPALRPGNRGDQCSPGAGSPSRCAPSWRLASSVGRASALPTDVLRQIRRGRALA